MKIKFFAILITILLTGCNSTKTSVITPDMVMTIIDAEMDNMKNSLQNGVIMAVWWCEDQREEADNQSALAIRIQNYLEQEFVRANIFTVVTRTQLDIIFEEQDLQWQSERYYRFRDDSVVSIAGVLGAKYIVRSRITQVNTLNLQILDTETGRIVYLSDTPIGEAK